MLSKNNDINKTFFMRTLKEREKSVLIHLCMRILF